MINSADQLEEKLSPLLHRWHKCARPTNDGNAGNTIEDLLGIAENNLSLPDFGDIEIKTQEYETGSLLTLFHLEPKPGASVPKLLKALGWRHQEAGGKHPADEKSFRSTTYAHRHSVRGFCVRLDKKLNRIFFEFSPDKVHLAATDNTKIYSNYGEWLLDVQCRPEPNYRSVFPIYYDLTTVESSFRTKLDHTLLVRYKKKIADGTKYFSFEEATLTRNLQFARVCELFDQGIIVVDFDARTRHNHGTKFRIQKNSLGTLFDSTRSIA